MARKKALELTFQQHIADFLVREHKYGVLEQSDITDTEHYIAEDQLSAIKIFDVRRDRTPCGAASIRRNSNLNSHIAVQANIHVASQHFFGEILWLRLHLFPRRDAARTSPPG